MNRLSNPAELASALAYVRQTPENRAAVGRFLRALPPNDEAYELWANWIHQGCSGVIPASEWEALDLDPEKTITMCELFKHARESGWDGGYEGYANRGKVPFWAIARERERKLKEFDLRHGLVLLNGVAAVVYRQFEQEPCVITTQAADVDSMRVRFANQHVPVLKHYPELYTLSEKTLLMDEWLRWEHRRTYSRAVANDEEFPQSMDLPDSEEIGLPSGVFRRFLPPTQTARVLEANRPLQPLETLHVLQPSRTEIPTLPQDVSVGDFE